VQFEFEILDPSMPGDLEINVQNDQNSGTGRRSSYLGRVVIPLNNVPPKGEAVKWYPLQRRGLFSQIKGDLGSVLLTCRSTSLFIVPVLYIIA